MTKMQELIAQRQNHQEAVDELTSQQSRMVWRVLNVFRRSDFSWKQPNYHSGSPNNELVGNHLWAQSFDEFEIEGDMLRAGGMYQGARGYYEHESVRFPVAWLEMDDDALNAAIRNAWQDYLNGIDARKQADAEAAALAREARDRAEFERLKEKYNG